MTITLYYKYLKADINQHTYRFSNKIEDAEVRSDAQSDERTTDMEFYRRKIEEAIAHLKLLLKDHLLEPQPSGDDILNTEKYAWQLNIDDTIKADANAIAELMHWYVVHYAVLEWAEMYAVDAVSTLASELSSAEESLTDALYNISLPTKHRRKRIDLSSEVSIINE